MPLNETNPDLLVGIYCFDAAPHSHSDLEFSPYELGDPELLSVTEETFRITAKALTGTVPVVRALSDAENELNTLLGTFTSLAGKASEAAFAGNPEAASWNDPLVMRYRYATEFVVACKNMLMCFPTAHVEMIRRSRRALPSMASSFTNFVNVLTHRFIAFRPFHLSPDVISSLSATELEIYDGNAFDRVLEHV